MTSAPNSFPRPRAAPPTATQDAGTGAADGFCCRALPSPFALAIAVTTHAGSARAPVREAFVFVIERGRHFFGFERRASDGATTPTIGSLEQRVLDKMVRAQARGRMQNRPPTAAREAGDPAPDPDLLARLMRIEAFRPHLAWMAKHTASETLRKRLETHDDDAPSPSHPTDTVRRSRTAVTPDLVLESICDPAAVRGALRHVASTVHVVSLSSPSGAFHATTATAVVSVCLDPPTLAVCLNRSNAISAHAREGARIAISALGRDQQEVAAGCAGGLPHEERGRFFTTAGPRGHRVVAGCTASFSGRCARTVEVGTHLVLLIEIEEVATAGSAEPLVYLDGRYGGFADGSQ